MPSVRGDVANAVRSVWSLRIRDFTLAIAPRSAGGPANSSSTICWCWPGHCCAIPSTASGAGPAARPLRAPPARRVPGHRSHPDRAGRAHRGGRSRPVTGRAAPWDQVTVTPGHLFVVGDPKQSIYRFRRADISTFLIGRGPVRHRTGGPVELTTNFRTVRSGHRVGEHDLRRTHGRARRRRRAGTLAARLHRARIPPAPARRRTTDCGARTHRTRPRPCRPTISGRPRPPTWQPPWPGRSARSGRSPTAPAAGGRPASGTSRSWCPARTSLPFLEDALDAAGIPSGPRRARSSMRAGRSGTCSWCCGRSTIPPTISTSSPRCARRCSGCGDDDLFRFKGEAQGPVELPRRPAGDRAGSTTRSGRGSAYLRSLYDQRQWLAPSELLDRIVRDRRVMELGFTEGRPRDVWRRLRFVIDQARAWSDATGGNLRQYLAWVAQQTAEGARVAESVLPETDDDAVRIMTIHGAKGLRVPDHHRLGHVDRCRPVAVLRPRWCSRPRATSATGSASDVTTSEYDALGTDRRADGPPRADPPPLRGLHPGPGPPRRVAATARSGPRRRSRRERTNAELLIDGMGSVVTGVCRTPSSRTGRRSQLVHVTPPSPPPPFDDVGRQSATRRSSGLSRPTTRWRQPHSPRRALLMSRKNPIRGS